MSHEVRVTTNITMHCRYEILQCGNVEKLIKKRESPRDPFKYFVPIEDTFVIIKHANIATEHGGHVVSTDLSHSHTLFQHFSL